MSGGERQSQAVQPSLIDDPIEEARKESENAIAQIDRVLDMVDDVTRGSRPFRCRPSLMLDLHRIAMEGLSAYAGGYRPGHVEIGGSKHTPPGAHLVPSLIEEMCDYVEANFEAREAIHLCAYIMWRLNWIHPFTDGNGRTSRAFSYYVLCCKVGYRLSGNNTVPEQIAGNKQPYYDALEAADIQYEQGQTDLSSLEKLLDECIAAQLLAAYDDARNPVATRGRERKLH